MAARFNSTDILDVDRVEKIELGSGFLSREGAVFFFSPEIDQESGEPRNSTCDHSKRSVVFVQCVKGSESRVGVGMSEATFARE